MIIRDIVYTEDMLRFLATKTSGPNILSCIIDVSLHRFEQVNRASQLGMSKADIGSIASAIVNTIVQSIYTYLRREGVSEELAYNIDVFSYSIDDTIEITVNYLPRACTTRNTCNNIH